MTKTIILTLLFPILFGNELPFSIGEKLVYSARFNIIKSGEAILEVLGSDTINGTATYHVRFSAKTNSTLDRIFKIRDKVDIWLGENDLSTYKLKKIIHEGNYRKKMLTTMFYDDSLAIINGDTVHINGPIQNPYSLFYYLRFIPLHIGQKLNFISFENKKTTPFQLMVTGKETIETEAGSFNCILVKPLQQGKKLLKHEGHMQVWFSDDDRRLPVQIRLKLKFGSMVFKLKQVSN